MIGRNAIKHHFLKTLDCFSSFLGIAIVSERPIILKMQCQPIYISPTIAQLQQLQVSGGGAAAGSCSLTRLTSTQQCKSSPLFGEEV